MKPFDEILSLLAELQSYTSGGEIPGELEAKLLVWARKVGAGALGVRGTLREDLRTLLGDDPSLRDPLLSFLDGESPAGRSWAGTFVEQLLPREEARRHLLKALRSETDAYTASWLAMNLARLTERPPPQEVCNTIGEAHTRFTGDPDSRRQIARAWGYAGCHQALPILADDLIKGGYDQKAVALDGMGALGSVDHSEAQHALWEVFESTQWQDIRSRTAHLLTRFSGTAAEESIRRMVAVLTSTELAEEHRQAAAEALSSATLPRALMEESLETLLAGLALSRGAIAANIVKALKNTLDDWAERLAHYAVQVRDDRILSSLSHALASEPEARRKAVRILNQYASDSSGDARELATAALKEIGGEEAFQSLEELLQSRYIQPSTDLQEASFKVFTDTIERMRRNYEASIKMNSVVFWLGIVVVVAGIGSAFLGPDGGAVFGTAGVVAGLGTLVSLFLFGPLNRYQHALTELVQIEVTFVSFMHRLLQARSIFEQLYLAGDIDLDGLARFDELLESSMRQTVELLEANVTTLSSDTK